MKALLLVAGLSLALALPLPAAAHGSEASSALSLLPVGVSVALPALLIAGTLSLSVVAVEASAQGTVWVLERASDGARVSVQLSARAVQGSALAVGTTVVVSAVTSGYILSTAGQALAFIPNEIGASLLYNERITPRVTPR